MVFFATLWLAAACSSSSMSKRPENVPKPDVQVRVGEIFFGSGTTAPLPIDVAIINTGKQAIAVRRVFLETPSMMQFGIYPFERIFNETIEPGATGYFQMSPTAWASRSRLSPNEPLNLRVWVDFQSGEAHWRDVYNLR